MKRRRFTKKQRKKITLIVVLGCVLLFVMGTGSIFYTDYRDSELLKEQSQLINFTYPYATNTYQWDKLSSDGAFMSYEDDSYTSQQGIDVSSHQGDIDWQAVSDAGVDFAFIRAAYRGYGAGTLLADDYYDQNMQGAQKAGLKVGIYVFSQAITVEEAAEEADAAIAAAKKYQLDLPIVYDMEESIDGVSGRIASLSAEEKTTMAVTFMNRVKAAGYDTMYYGSTSLLENLFELQYMQDYPLWVAEYDASYPNYPYVFDYWQYTSTAVIPGIDGIVDMDIRFVAKD